MIDLARERAYNLSDLCQFVPPGRDGKKTHLSTLLRWILKGVRTATGQLVKLEALRLGGRWICTRESLQRFAEALTPHLDGDPLSTPRTPGKRQRAAEAAGKQLEKVGI
jgi:hypothetical protein